MSRTRLNLDDVVFALRETHGLLTHASERLGCSRAGPYLFIERHPKAREALKDAREALVDKAEQALLECIQERQPWAIALVLKTLGKSRGWTEQPTAAPMGDRAIQLY
jgi:transposase